LLQQQQHDWQQQQIIEIENNKMKNPRTNGPINSANYNAIYWAKAKPVLPILLLSNIDLYKSTLY
jgi:hypothetical protein